MSIGNHHHSNSPSNGGRGLGSSPRRKLQLSLWLILIVYAVLIAMQHNFYVQKAESDKERRSLDSEQYYYNQHRGAFTSFALQFQTPLISLEALWNKHSDQLPLSTTTTDTASTKSSWNILHDDDDDNPTRGKKRKPHPSAWIRRLPIEFDPSLHNATVPVRLLNGSARIDFKEDNQEKQSTASSSTIRIPDSQYLPGLFWKRRLFLLGVRLTTSYEVNDSSVSLTVFGMPGDFDVREKSEKIRCPANHWYGVRNAKLWGGEDDSSQGKGGSILSYQATRKHVKLYVRVDNRNAEDEERQESDPFPLTFFYSSSGDINQNNNTLIWHGDLEESFGISKGELVRQFHGSDDDRQGAAHSPSSSSPSPVAMRVHIYASYVSEIQNHTTHNRTISESELEHVMTVDIPLSTGVVGQAGPQLIAPSRSSLFLEEEFSNAYDGSNNVIQSGDQTVPSANYVPQKMDAALCVAIYGGESSLRFVPEFVMHHVNIGFGQIIVGIVDENIGSEGVLRARESLQDFIDHGLVTMAAMGMLPVSDFGLNCEVNVRKVHFYNACLYHAKGIAKYVGIWDLDEFWVPPVTSAMLKLKSSSSSKINLNETATTTTTSSSTDTLRTNNQPEKKQNQLSRLPQPAPGLSSIGGIGKGTEDGMNAAKLWSQSTYSKAFTVGEIMSVIQQYHTMAGCGESWCYNAFPSSSVYLRRHRNSAMPNGWDTEPTSRRESSSNKDNLQTGQGLLVSQDFEMRDVQELDMDWSKSITRTKYAWMGGLHQSGSCHFSSTPRKFLFELRNDVLWNSHPYSNVFRGPGQQQQQQQEETSDQSKQAPKQKCRNLRLENEVFGVIHHFSSLNRERQWESYFDSQCQIVNATSTSTTSSLQTKHCVVDEYVTYFGETVRQQLALRRQQRQQS